MRRSSITLKMMLMNLFLVLATVTLMGVLNHSRLSGSLYDLGGKFAANVVERLYDTARMQNSITQEKVNSDLLLMEYKFNEYGSVRLDESKSIQMTIVNQITKEKENVTIPSLLAGDHVVNNNFDIVDGVQKLAGGTATVFQVLPGKLLRVSTNVKKLDGNRATGTYIPDSSPVYETCMRGETYRGKAFVVNDWYLTAYKPMRDASGKIVAVIYVGRKIMTPQLKDVIERTNVAGAGYAFTFNSKGEFLFHPDDKMMETNIKDYSFGDLFIQTKDGLLDYDYNGERKFAYVKYFEPWDWYFAVVLGDEEMLHGMDKKLINSVLINGCISIVLAIIVSWLLVSRMTRPIRNMVGVARAIMGGDAKARMEVKSSDEIGELAVNFNGMMDKIDETLCQNETYINMINSVTDPIFAVDDEFKILVANESTAALIGKKAEEVKGIQCYDVFHTPVCKTNTCPINMAKKAGREVQSDIIEATIKGEVKYLKPMGAPLVDCHGNHSGYMEIARDVTDMVEKEQHLARTLDQVQQINQAVRESSMTMADQMDTLNYQIQEVQQGADLQSRRTGETATSMEEMSATVLEVARNASNAAENAAQAKQKAEEGAQVVNKAVVSIAEVEKQILELKDKMSTLGNRAQNIGQIINVINDIADQTNLLALNAAIEAARAGDAGRGFAVVADEVRKLAEKTMGATKEVELAIAEIQKGTQDNITATERAAEGIVESTRQAQESGDRLQQILSLVVTTTEQVQSIATAAEQQSAASEEIGAAVEEVNRIASENADGMNQAARAVALLAQEANKLKGLSEREI